MQFTYVYTLIDQSAEHRYVGVTDDLTDRLSRHNRGEMRHTAKHRPWRIESAIAFESRVNATRMETYLKSHAGREWAKRHL